MTEKTLTTENIKPALDALRGELAPWPVVAKKQDRLNTAQLNAANSGITSSLVAQIIANTAAIRALESAITGTGLRALVVSSLPAVGTTGILYIVPVTTYDPDTDADVVNYSNEYIWIPVEGGTASEGHYEQVGQTGIVINNGQLNITVNGTSVGTFTANQSGDTTAAITVPTNADYVDKTTAQSIAGVKTFSSTIIGTASKAIADEDGTSIKTGYVNVAGNQTVSGDKSFTGSNTFNSILPNTTNTYSLGSSSYQWASVYAQSYYYNGTAWGLDKANTWTNVNTFNGSTNTTVILQRGGSSYYSDIRFADETSHVLGCIRVASTAGLQIGYQRSSTWYDGSQIILKDNGSLQFVLNDGTNTTNIIVNATEIKPTNSVADLGTSTNKWKTLNGINPGALSLPDLSSDGYVDLSSNLTENVQYTYTPVVDGWLALYCQTTGFHAENAVGIFNGGGSSYSWACSTTSAINLLRRTTYHGAVTLPVKAGIPYLCLLTINSSTTLSSKRLYFYKAQGNV